VRATGWAKSNKNKPATRVSRSTLASWNSRVMSSTRSPWVIRGPVPSAVAGSESLGPMRVSAIQARKGPIRRRVEVPVASQFKVALAGPGQGDVLLAEPSEELDSTDPARGGVDEPAVQEIEGDEQPERDQVEPEALCGGVKDRRGGDPLRADVVARAARRRRSTSSTPHRDGVRRRSCASRGQSVAPRPRPSVQAGRRPAGRDLSRRHQRRRQRRRRDDPALVTKCLEALALENLQDYNWH
jgi:hypothetical protein